MSIPLLLKDFLQIAIIAVVLHYIFLWIRGTRTASILIGLLGLITGLLFVTAAFSLDVVAQILRAISVYFWLALIIVFHPEIRKILGTLGNMKFGAVWRGSALNDSPVEVLSEVSQALALQKTGALIAVERQEALTHYAETGVELDALLSTELLTSIFHPPLPLHDGGIIVRKNRVIAARCIFPVSDEMDKETVSKFNSGLRHRAALGLSEQTDAMIIVISEETGGISIAHDGEMRRNLDEHKLLRYLKAVYVPKEKQNQTFSLIFGGPQQNIFVRFFMSLRKGGVK